MTMSGSIRVRTAEAIQIKLKDTIPTSQFWTDVTHNGNQIYFIGNE